MPRTIVVSDLHGSVDLLDDIIDHSGFAPGVDRLVIAGDLLDVGTDDTIGRAEELGATVLAGNHEVSAAIGLRITPQNPETRAMAPELARRLASGEWPLAAAVDGWLVTHAGVSATLDDIVCGRTDVGQIAEHLNALFRDEMASAVRRMPLDYAQIGGFRLLGGELGPLWFRPLDQTQIPSGIRQIVGHTPPELLGEEHVATLRSRGWLLIEPGGHTGGGSGPRMRYAIVEDGAARVLEA